MARIKHVNQIISRTLTWTFSGGRTATLEVRVARPRIWYDSAESHDAAWLVTDLGYLDVVLAARLTLS